MGGINCDLFSGLAGGDVKKIWKYGQGDECDFFTESGR
jgi:hypothetical protein